MWDVPFTVLQFDYLSLTICCLSLSLTVTKDLKFCFPFLMISQVLFWTQFVKVPTLNCTYYNKFLAQIQLQKKTLQSPLTLLWTHFPLPPEKKNTNKPNTQSTQSKMKSNWNPNQGKPIESTTKHWIILFYILSRLSFSIFVFRTIFLDLSFISEASKPQYIHSHLCVPFSQTPHTPKTSLVSTNNFFSSLSNSPNKFEEKLKRILNEFRT